MVWQKPFFLFRSASPFLLFKMEGFSIVYFVKYVLSLKFYRETSQLVRAELRSEDRFITWRFIGGD